MAVGILWDPLAPRIHTPESTGKALSWLLSLRSVRGADYLNNVSDALVSPERPAHEPAVAVGIIPICSVICRAK
jgi:hypothetical protein